MMVLLTEEEYRGFQFKPCDKCEATKRRFDEAGLELVQTLLQLAHPMPGVAKDPRFMEAFQKFSKTL